MRWFKHQAMVSVPQSSHAESFCNLVREYGSIYRGYFSSFLNSLIWNYLSFNDFHYEIT